MVGTSPETSPPKMKTVFSQSPTGSAGSARSAARWCPISRSKSSCTKLAGATEQKFVVTAVPDGKKGERLVVLHTLKPEELKSVLENLPQSGLPNLWTPRPNQFFAVEEFPHLGTGKLDLAPGPRIGPPVFARGKGVAQTILVDISKRW